MRRKGLPLAAQEMHWIQQELRRKRIRRALRCPVVRVFRQPPVIATLTSIQLGVVSKLLREYPRGRLKRRGRTPTFIAESASEIFEVDLSSMRIVYLERRSWGRAN